MTRDLHVEHNGPDLLDYLAAAVETVEKVAPNLFDRAHPAGDLVVQDGSGHFVMDSLAARPTREDTRRCGVWAFLDMGQTLNVLTCRIHGNTIDPARARALGEHLIARADRTEPRT